MLLATDGYVQNHLGQATIFHQPPSPVAPLLLSQTGIVSFVRSARIIKVIFSAPHKVREHFEKHLRQVQRHEYVRCLDEFCGLVLHGHQALKRHAADVHKIRYFTEAQRVRAGL